MERRVAFRRRDKYCADRQSRLDHDPFKASQIQGAKKPTFKGSRLNGILQAHYFHALSDFTDHQDA